jgi:hypothetical protein
MTLVSHRATPNLESKATWTMLQGGGIHLVLEWSSPGITLPMGHLAFCRRGGTDTCTPAEESGRRVFQPKAQPHIPVATASPGRALPSKCQLEEATPKLLLSSTALSQSSDRQQSMACWRCDPELSLSSNRDPNIPTTNQRPSQDHATRHKCRSGVVVDELERVAALQQSSHYKNARDALLLSMAFGGTRMAHLEPPSQHTPRLTPEF